VVTELGAKGLLSVGRTAQTVRHLFLLLSATDPDAGRRDGGLDDPEARRLGVFEAVRDLFVALARSRPLVLVFEDLHWADALTLDLIGFLMDCLGPLAPGPRPALGLLCVYRPLPDRRCRRLPALASARCPDRYTEIALRDLTPVESAELVGALLETGELPELLTRSVLDRSQGNPFFLEEIVRSLIDTGVLYRGRGGWRARAERLAGGVPESVESVIRGTTDRLPSATRHTLRAASVLGRVFDAAVVRGMTRDEEATEANLRLLEDTGLIYEERTVPRREYSFRHVLTRDAVYAGISEQTRRELHERAAHLTLELSGDRPEPYLERLAFHFERAGLQEQAVHYLHQAGRKAIRASDNQAAIELLERALALVHGWTPGPERAATELEIQVSLGVPVTATTGYGSADTRKVYQRAVDLCSPGDSSAAAFAATYGLWRYHTVQGHLGPSLELTDRLLDSCKDSEDDAQALEAQRALGCALTHAGRLEEADRVLEAGMAAYDPARHSGNAFVYGHDPATTFYCYRALCLWLLGFPDAAAATIDRLTELLRDSSHRLSVTYICGMGAQVFQLRGEVQRVLSMSSRGVALAAEGHFPMFGNFAKVLQGWALGTQGETDRGVRTIREGMELWEATAGGSFRPYMRSLLADTMRRAGDSAGAVSVLEQTIGELESGGCDRVCDSEPYRLLGEIRLDAGDAAGAEPCLAEAAAIAEAAHARSMQLRAAISLARFHALRGKPDAGRQLVQEAVTMIQEGQGTSDLREATRLLESLR
jgi:adenylate cyclase